MNNSNQQHIKSYNPNAKGKNRIKFTSSRQRAKRASADVYRSYKRNAGTAASREERVHHPEHFNSQDIININAGIRTRMNINGDNKKRKGVDNDEGQSQSQSQSQRAAAKKVRISRIHRTTNIETAGSNNNNGKSNDGSKMAIVKFHHENDNNNNNLQSDDEMDNHTGTSDMMDVGLDTKTTFAMELDLSKSRNGSQLFGKVSYTIFMIRAV